ncbi:MAG TPA: hypothetical protein VMR62_01840, partial [Bryobacteraceae bacterium]|nr:hypothetical protein [Bryobacteraceae bacterium]
MGQRAGRRAAFDVALIVEPRFEKDFRRVLDNRRPRVRRPRTLKTLQKGLEPMNLKCGRIGLCLCLLLIAGDVHGLSGK